MQLVELRDKLGSALREESKHHDADRQDLR